MKKIYGLIILGLALVVLLNTVSGYTLLEDNQTILLNPPVANTNHLNFNFDGDSESYFNVILMSNYAVSNCTVSPFYKCSVSEGERIEVSRDFSTHNAFLYEVDNLEVFVYDEKGNTATANIRVNYINFASYIKTQSIQSNDLMNSLPWIFRVKNNKIIGIHIFPMLSLVLFIWWRLKK